MQNFPPAGYRTKCPQCKKCIITVIHHTPTIRTHLMAMVLCIVMCWPCACLPYCIEDFHDTHHYCPVCDAYIGVHQGLL